MSESTIVTWCSFLNQLTVNMVGHHIKVNVMGLDYDTWKTTDFEYERQCEEDEALESAQTELANDLFDAYMAGDNDYVINEVDEYLIEDEDFFKMLRSKYEPKSWVKDRGAAMHKAYIDYIAEVCNKISKQYDDFDKLEGASLDFKL